MRMLYVAPMSVTKKDREFMQLRKYLALRMIRFLSSAECETYARVMARFPQKERVSDSGAATA